jgi:hypothetical protein
MSCWYARFSLWLIPPLFLLLWPRTAQGQGSVGKTHSVTGCLQKGIEPGGFFIVGEDGTMWELSGKVDAAHTGHKKGGPSSQWGGPPPPRPHQALWGRRSTAISVVVKDCNLI